MTEVDWIGLLSQLGVAGVAMVVIVKVIMPAFLAESARIAGLLGGNTAAIDRAAERITLAITTAAERAANEHADVSERLARLESIVDHAGPVRANGTGR